MSPQDLPDTVREIAEVVGVNSALKLSGRVRHRKLYVPKEFKEGHWIATEIGESEARRLSKTFGGCLLDLASCFALRTAQRREAMRREYQAGASVHDLMARHGMSKRGVQYALKGLLRPRRWLGRKSKGMSQ
jgi:hypothetical protein